MHYAPEEKSPYFYWLNNIKRLANFGINGLEPNQPERAVVSDHSDEKSTDDNELMHIEVLMRPA